MVLAIEIDVNHLFLWDPILFEGTFFELNRVGLLTLVGAALCIGFFMYAVAKKSLIPRGSRSIAETMYLFVRNNIAIDVIGPEGAKYAGYLASVFFFILFMNVMAIIPGIHFAPTSRMAIPFMLSFLTYIIFNVVGIIKQGPLGYLKNTLVPPGAPGWVYILLTPIEFFSVFIVRPLTLMVRLLANMMAGHVLLTIFFVFTHDFLWTNFGPAAPLGLLTIVVAAALMMLEMLVIVMQAYIFTMLTTFYIAESIHGHGAEEHLASGEETHDDHKHDTQPVTEGVAA
ncbi:MAG TPA: F0F1 ATP synthase subunit A [Actinomycetota bacterium]|nr:F0F1 ATP synthase subunit A [Actinomycetota bacterium]